MTANPLKGEVGFTAGGADYVLTYTIETLCMLEEKLDMSISKIATTLVRDPRLGFVRTLLWGGLQARHDGITVREAGELIGDLKIDGALELIGRAIKQAFPQPKEDASGDAGPQGSAGTGQPS